jgi:hypothetical protein
LRLGPDDGSGSSTAPAAASSASADCEWTVKWQTACTLPAGKPAIVATMFNYTLDTACYHNIAGTWFNGVSAAMKIAGLASQDSSHLIQLIAPASPA